MSQKLTPEQAFAHASALLPIVAITGTSDGYSHGWTVMPRLTYCRKLWTADGKGQSYCIGHDNIQWPAGDIEKQIYSPPVSAPTDEDAKQHPLVMVRDYDDRDWEGPQELRAVHEDSTYPVITNIDIWRFGRFATPAEIATVEAKQ